MNTWSATRLVDGIYPSIPLSKSKSLVCMCAIASSTYICTARKKKHIWRYKHVHPDNRNDKRHITDAGTIFPYYFKGSPQYIWSFFPPSTIWLLVLLANIPIQYAILVGEIAQSHHKAKDIALLVRGTEKKKSGANAWPIGMAPLLSLSIQRRGGRLWGAIDRNGIHTSLFTLHPLSHHKTAAEQHT